MGRSYPVVNTGHGDLIETQNGEWWMVALASRPYGGYYRNMGRETFLIPVVWEEGWPIVSPGSGRIEMTYPAPSLPSFQVPAVRVRDNFDDVQLDDVWNFIRTPRELFWSLAERSGFLRINLRPPGIKDSTNPGFIGRRQQHINFSAGTVLEFRPQSQAETAGIAVIQSNDYHFRFEYGLNNGQNVIRLIQCEKGIDFLMAEKPFSAARIYLKVKAIGQDYGFFYGEDEMAGETLITKVNGRILSTDVAGGFVGTYIGIFASGNGSDNKNYADFDWFEYEEYIL